jgi:hypothetical protein
MSFLMRPPSASWEPVSLPTQPPIVIWAWFKPPNAPNAVVFQLPPQLFQALGPSSKLTMRMLLMAVGMESVVGWTLYGQEIALDADTMSWFDADLPPPPNGLEPQLTFWAPVHGRVPTAMEAPR